MYEMIVYVGSLAAVSVKNFEFQRDVPLAIPRSLATKLLLSSEFVQANSAPVQETDPVPTPKTKAKH